MKILICLMMGLSSSVSLAGYLIETAFDLNVNWASHRLQYMGYAKADPEKSLEELRQVALKNGLVSVVDKFQKLFTTYYPSLQSLGDVKGHEVAKSSYVVRWIFMRNGDVAVQLESRLANVLSVPDLDYYAGTTYRVQGVAGLILQLPKPVRAVPIYKIFDERGEVLYSYKSVSQEAFERNLMGRWFRSASNREIEEVGGPGKYPVLKVIQVVEGGFVVVRNEWDSILAVTEPSLIAGRVFLNLP